MEEDRPYFHLAMMIIEGVMRLLLLLVIVVAAVYLFMKIRSWAMAQRYKTRLLSTPAPVLLAYLSIAVIIAQQTRFHSSHW